MSTPPEDDPLAGSVAFHMGLAEQGKVHALAGDHRMALLYYREAIRLAVAKKAPEVFFRHYMECMLESLEHSGAFEEVLSYCERALAHHDTLQARDPEHARLIALDRASVHQREGVVRLKTGDAAGARAALDQAVRVARGAQVDLPLAQALFGWVARGFHVDARRIDAELQRHGYFSVRPDTVDADKAIPLPAAHLAALQPGV